MKENIHPKYFKTVAACACGATYEIGSTKENIRVDICAGCHPLFTGKQKLMDTAGRVEKFKKKYDIAAEKKAKLEEARKKIQELKQKVDEEKKQTEEERITEKLKTSEIKGKPKKEDKPKSLARTKKTKPKEKPKKKSK